MTQRHHTLLLCLACLLLTACNRQPKGVHIQGHLTGLHPTAIYFYGTSSPYDRMDSLIVNNGIFEGRLPIDTLTFAHLLLPDGRQHPLFLDKGQRLHIEIQSGNPPSIAVTGSDYNDQFTDFLRQYDSPSVDSLQRDSLAEAFINQHPASPVCLAVLSHCFPYKSEQHATRLRSLIEQLSGVLKDQPFIVQLTEQLASSHTMAPHRYAPYFNLPDSTGQLINRSSASLKDKYVVLHVWASWTDSTELTRQHLLLKRLHRKLGKNTRIAWVGMSLDLEREAWLQTLRRDTLKGLQLRDPEGVTSQTGRLYATHRLPYILLLHVNGQILSTDPSAEQLESTLDSLVALPPPGY